MALYGRLVSGELGFKSICVKDTAMSVGVRWGFVLLLFFFLYIWFPLLHKFFPYKLLGSYHLETDRCTTSCKSQAGFTHSHWPALHLVTSIELDSFLRE